MTLIYSLGEHCIKIRDVTSIDFESCFTFDNLVSAQPEIIKLSQMTNFNVTFHLCNTYQFIDWLKFETNHSSLHNTKMADSLVWGFYHWYVMSIGMWSHPKSYTHLGGTNYDKYCSFLDAPNICISASLCLTWPSIILAILIKSWVMLLAVFAKFSLLKVLKSNEEFFFTFCGVLFWVKDFGFLWEGDGC